MHAHDTTGQDKKRVRTPADLNRFTADAALAPVKGAMLHFDHSSGKEAVPTKVISRNREQAKGQLIQGIQVCPQVCQDS